MYCDSEIARKQTRESRFCMQRESSLIFFFFISLSLVFTPTGARNVGFRPIIIIYETSSFARFSRWFLSLHRSQSFLFRLSAGPSRPHA
jgi:hypothetical protein